jgi:hypothetical protein
MNNASTPIDLTDSMEIIDTDHRASELEVEKLKKVRVVVEISQYGSLPFRRDQKNRFLTAEKRILSRKVRSYYLPLAWSK